MVENNLMLMAEVNIYKIQMDDLHDMSVKKYGYNLDIH